MRRLQKARKQQGGGSILYAPTHYRSGADISSGWNDMTFSHKANNALGPFNELFLCSQPTSSQRCLTDARLSVLHEVHVFPLTGGLRGNAITKRPHNLHFFFHFPALDAASLSHFVLFSFCARRLLVFQDERHLFGSLQRVTQLWKSLVLQRCSFSILHPILRWWSKGSELREKLKDVCFGVNNNTNPQTRMRCF